MQCHLPSLRVDLKFISFPLSRCLKFKSWQWKWHDWHRLTLDTQWTAFAIPCNVVSESSKMHYSEKDIYYLIVMEFAFFAKFYFGPLIPIKFDKGGNWMWIILQLLHLPPAKFNKSVDLIIRFRLNLIFWKWHPHFVETS